MSKRRNSTGRKKKKLDLGKTWGENGRKKTVNNECGIMGNRIKWGPVMPGVTDPKLSVDKNLLIRLPVPSRGPRTFRVSFCFIERERDEEREEKECEKKTIMSE